VPIVAGEIRGGCGCIQSYGPSLGSILVGRLPEPIRRSFRQTLRDPLGVDGSVLFFAGAVLIWLPTLTRWM